MLNMWSAVGTVLAYNAASPNYADLAPGLAYALVLHNTTTSAITSGTMTMEGADARADDHCTPDIWAAIQEVPSCDVAPGTVTGPATITLSAQHPIPARSQCAYSAPCPAQFLRVTGVPAGITAIVVVTRLRRSDFSIGDARGDIQQMSEAP